MFCVNVVAMQKRNLVQLCAELHNRFCISIHLHASIGPKDLKIVRTLADYTIRHHFSHIDNMSISDSLSFQEDGYVVDLTSNKYAGEHLNNQI